MPSKQTKQRLFSTSFWTDDYVQELDRDTRHFYQYLITAPENNVSGVYQSSYKLMQFHDGWSKDEVDHHMATLSADSKVFFVDSWVIICNQPAHHKATRGDNLWSGIAYTFLDAPDPVKLFALEHGYRWDHVVAMVPDSYKGPRSKPGELAREISDTMEEAGMSRVTDSTGPLRTPSDPFGGVARGAEVSEHINPNSNSNSRTSKTLPSEVADESAGRDVDQPSLPSAVPKETRSEPIPMKGELEQQLDEAFRSIHEYANFGKERQHIKTAAKRCRARSPDNPAAYANEMLTAFEYLRHTDQWWRKQPFVPSMLVSQWDRIERTIEQARAYQSEQASISVPEVVF